MSTAIAIRDDNAVATTTANDSVLGSADAFEFAQRTAKMLASSTFIPTAFQGNVANCLVAMEMAARMRVSPLAVMQNLDVIHGTPALRAKFVTAVVNASGRYAHDIRFEAVETGGGGCYAWTHTRDGAVVKGPTVTMAMAQGEGWISKQGSKWKTMPELMLSYRAASFFARVHCPDLILGMRVVDEFSGDAPRTDGPPLSDGRGNDGYRAFARTPDNDPYGHVAAEPASAATAEVE